MVFPVKEDMNRAEMINAVLLVNYDISDDVTMDFSEVLKFVSLNIANDEEFLQPLEKGVCSGEFLLSVRKKVIDYQISKEYQHRRNKVKQSGPRYEDRLEVYTRLANKYCRI